MRTVTNLFLLNMAISDMLSTIFSFPVLLALQISPHYWPLGGFMCRASVLFSSISTSVSIFTMVVLALERYITERPVVTGGTRKILNCVRRPTKFFLRDSC